ncbi:MAG: DUF3784 domain-containing protein [Clostridiales bacterium]|nr:DUF3784 domain-containing protein [Clostridiales bacterium]
MIIEAIIYSLIGVILIILGFVTWKKQKISIIHSYHYQNVKTEDIPAYTRLMGIGQIVMGTGLCITAVLGLVTHSIMLSLIGFSVSLVIGVIIFHKAQIKYNGSWFS